MAGGSHHFADEPSVSTAALTKEPFTYHDPKNGRSVWVDELAAEQGENASACDVDVDTAQHLHILERLLHASHAYGGLASLVGCRWNAHARQHGGLT
ncbi:MAG: hypothetical protein QOH97_4668 [Actinoplanes sp.]|nr:hypothetical protein [Actinoplanes sp.]